MIYKWESEEKRILWGMSISPQKKLEALRLMNELADKVLTDKQKKIRQKLRENN